jgi:hypothetical protein
VAAGIVDLAANNQFSNDMCIHGQQGVHLRNGNEFMPGAKVTMPDLANGLVTPGGKTGGNPGLVDAMGEKYLAPRMVNHVSQIIDDLLTLKPSVTPNYIDTLREVIVKDETYNFSDVKPGNIYHIKCAANKNVGIPNNTVLNSVVIVADCQIGVGPGVEMSDVVLASTAMAPGGANNGGQGGTGVGNANINFSSNVILGVDDDCQPGGGVQIFSNASVHFASTTTYNGVQIVVSGDIDLGARDMGINGINAQAGGDITMTINNKFGLCTGGAPDLFTVGYYRLVY